MLDIKLQTFFAAFRQRSMVVIIVIEIHPFMMQAKLVLLAAEITDCFLLTYLESVALIWVFKMMEFSQKNIKEKN